MSSSKHSKSQDQKLSRKVLIADIGDLRAKLDKRQRKITKLNDRLDTLAKELRKSLLTLGKRQTEPTPLAQLSALPTPPAEPSLSQIEIAAYHAYLKRIHENRDANPEADWFRAEADLWKNIALHTHAEAIRLAQQAAQPKAPPSDSPGDLTAVAK
jgi:hypothetical protein